MLRKHKKEVGLGIIVVAIIFILCNYEMRLHSEAIVEEKKQFQGIDTWSFGDAFNYMYTLYGEGHIFEWRGNQYKAILKEGK